MAKPIACGRYTDLAEGPLVVFLIGMRINRLWRVDKWMPVARAMGPMIAELARDPDSGFLGAEFMLCGLRTIMTVQYWRDFDSLERYARDRDRKHWPAWTAFNKRSAPTAPSVSSTKPTSFPPAGTRRSMPTCRRSDSAR